MKKGQLIGLAIGTAGLAAVVYFGFIKKFDGLTQWQKLMGKKPEDKKDDTKTPDGTGTGTGTGTTQVQSGFPLKFGSTGEFVNRLQTALMSKKWNKDLGTSGKTTGKFRAKTEKALVEIGYGKTVDSILLLQNIEMGKENPKISPTPPAPTGSGIKTGANVYAAVDLATYTKPEMKSIYAKSAFKKYEPIGLYMGDSPLKGWGIVRASKVGEYAGVDSYVMYNQITTTSY